MGSLLGYLRAVLNFAAAAAARGNVTYRHHSDSVGFPSDRRRYKVTVDSAITVRLQSR